MDKALKQRLVGASVLIILAVIILPMLLSGRSDILKQESREIELPAKPEELSIETRRFPVGVPGKPMVEKQAEESLPNEDEPVETEKPEVSSAVLTQAPVSDVQTPEAEAGELKPPAGEVEKLPGVTSITLSTGADDNPVMPETPGESTDTPRYLVQVASFSNEKNANALAGQLRSDNLSVLMDVVDRPAGRLHRVRVGPYADRADADAVVENIGLKMKDLRPRVLDLRPDESAPVSMPSDPLVRWVVQVGSFNSEKSAETLVAKLRLAGLPTFSEKVTSQGNVVYKVKIGPELDRASATELAGKVKADHGLDGFVTTQE
jgi:DedD protein